MKNVLHILTVMCLPLIGYGQASINITLQSPPINESIFNGKFLKPYQLYEYSSQRTSVSPGIEIDRLFQRGPDEAKLYFSIGASYAAIDLVGVSGSSDNNELVSQIKGSMINIPTLVRGSVKISELLENNRLGLELGLVTTGWMKYSLDETAAVKTKDANNNVIGETIYSDKGDLVSSFGEKFNVKGVAGMFVYINRFYLGFRMDIISFGDLYSDKLEASWQVPAQYSVYQLSHQDGRMKRIYASLNISFRLTK